MADFAKWREESTPDEVTVSVCLNRRLLRDFHEASERLQAVKQDGMLDAEVAAT